MMMKDKTKDKSNWNIFLQSYKILTGTMLLFIPQSCETRW